MSLFTDIRDTIQILEKQHYRELLGPTFAQFQVAPISIIIQIPDPLIIQGIKNLDNDVFSYLYNKFYPEIERIILSRKGNIADAKDIFQETLIDLIIQAKSRSLKIKTEFRSYINKIAANKWYKRYQKIKKYPEISIEKDITDQISPLLKEDIERPVNFDTISIWIQYMSSSCRSIIEKFYYERKKFSEIAQELGYSNEHTARNQKYKCIESLKDRLAANIYNMY